MNQSEATLPVPDCTRGLGESMWGGHRRSADAPDRHVGNAFEPSGLLE
jgi:hypothetical protein